MAYPVANDQLITFLIAEGLVPDECVLIDVEFRVDSLVQIQYRVNLTDERLEAFYRAFASYLESTRKKKSLALAYDEHSLTDFRKDN